MKKLLSILLCVAVVGAGIFVGAQPQKDLVKVRLRLLDAKSGKAIVGMVRVTDADNKTVEVAGLYDRMTSLTKDLPGVHWYIVPAGGADAMLPRKKLLIEALSGLETERVSQRIDLRGKAPEGVDIRLPFLFRAADAGLVAGNTHLHLRNMTLAKSDEYLRNIPAADGLGVMFISYLERDKDDLNYITNQYPIGAMPALTKASGVLFNNGEEHRHNFTGYGEGYGHVMFLNIKELVKPISIGPGITGGGFDDPVLRAGIDNARKQGGTVIWCHNTNGFEDVPSAVTGRLDGINVFDGSRNGRFEDNYYRYLNIGLKMPISTGTDWFMYDWSRVYAKVHGKLSIATWLDAVKAGRCQATNGPLLSLEVDGKSSGEVIDLNEPKTLKIEASAVSRGVLKKLELIRNGQVIKTQLADGKESSKARIVHSMRVEEPAWFAVRIESDAKNEFDKGLYAHTSPVYVRYKGKDVFDVDAALALLKQVEEGQATIRAKGRFSSDAAGRKVSSLYDEAAENLRARINARK